MSESSLHLVRQQVYSVTNDATAFGNTYCFFGPGISRYSNSVHLLQPLNEWATIHWTTNYSNSDAQRIICMLNCAYEAGRKSMQQDIQKALGIK